MEWVLGILILLLGVISIMVIYFSERIRVFETLLNINPKVSTDRLAEHIHFGPNPFGQLSGENLWKAMVGEPILDPTIILDDIESLRSRFGFVLASHIEALVEEARFDCRHNERNTARSILRVSMLKGSVESYLPPEDAGKLYEIGQGIEQCIGKTDDQSKKKAIGLSNDYGALISEIFDRAQSDLPDSLWQAISPFEAKGKGQQTSTETTSSTNADSSNTDTPLSIEHIGSEVDQHASNDTKSP